MASISFGVLVFSYLLGAIPFGLLLVRLRTGQDVRMIGSGRTGTTNVLRAAGPAIAILTLLLDMFKGGVAVWLARCLVPDSIWLETLAPVMAIAGHNFSIFLAERDESGRWHLRGGAGGATALGGALALYPISALLLIPAAIIIYFGAGYASVATMGVPLIAIFIFGPLAWKGITPWNYVVYLVMGETLILWALRPNIRRLLHGTERGIGWRAKKERQTKDTDNQ